MFDYLKKKEVINLREFIADSKNHLVWKLGIEFERVLIDECELNFDKPFLHFNVKKKICQLLLSHNIFK